MGAMKQAFTIIFIVPTHHISKQTQQVFKNIWKKAGHGSGAKAIYFVTKMRGERIVLTASISIQTIFYRYFEWVLSWMFPSQINLHFPLFPCSAMYIKHRLKHFIDCTWKVYNICQCIRQFIIPLISKPQATLPNN